MFDLKENDDSVVFLRSENVNGKNPNTRQAMRNYYRKTRCIQQFQEKSSLPIKTMLGT